MQISAFRLSGGFWRRYNPFEFCAEKQLGSADVGFTDLEAEQEAHHDVLLKGANTPRPAEFYSLLACNTDSPHAIALPIREP